MPRAMELALLKKAKQMGLSKKRSGAFVYGTMRKTGWVPSTQKKQMNRSDIIRHIIGLIKAIGIENEVIENLRQS